jgi:hypothetical protein
MLVDNKFLFLKIPRTATVAFERSCFLAELSIKYPSGNVLAQRQADKGIEPRRHAHETFSKLREYFGDEYPVIAIERDPLDRFLSAWKYVIKSVSEHSTEVSKTLSNVDNKTFINAWQSEIGHSANLRDIPKCENFFKRLIHGGIPYNKNVYMLFTSVMTGPSRWHENNPDILYFNIRDTKTLENYVREITGKPFELIVTNHTKTTDSNLVLDNTLKEFYFNTIEPPYKTSVTLI